MARIELIRELKIREQELTEELEAIRKILSSNLIPANNLNGTKSPVVSSNSKYTPKGEMVWEEYVMTILKEIGGKGRAGDVYNAAIEANPDIDEKTIKHAVKGKLSKLYVRKEIGANEGRIKSEGHEYYLFNNSESSNTLTDNQYQQKSTHL